MVILISLFLAFGLVAFILGLQTIVFFPLTISYEIWKKRFFKKWGKEYTPFLSVIIPAFNEENTIRGSIESILASDYPQFEVIMINDGSHDNTEDTIQDFVHSKKIIYLKTPNLGKARALNKGIELAQGEVIVYTDADSFFLPNTLKNLARWFVDPKIQAVCGNDTPIAPQTSLQKLLVITTHIGTGFVRRALSFISSLHIITGNLGAVKTDTIKSLGGFVSGWGEDLEITFRLHKARKKIVFDHEPMVLAECPGNLKNLWKQRIRWMRSYLKVCKIHKNLFFNPKYAPFSFYLPLNFSSLVIVPFLQIITFLILPFLLKTGNFAFQGPLSLVAYSGLLYFFIISIYSCILDRSPKDLRLLIPFGFLILPLSYFYNLVVIYSFFKEIVRKKEQWEWIEKRKTEEISVSPKRNPASVFLSSIIIISLALIIIYSFYRKNKPAYNPIHVTSGSIFALATHFDAWEDWKEAIHSVVNSHGKGVINTVGVGAGRMEWTYFKWKKHPENWSNHQKGAKKDLLLEAADAFHQKEWSVIAIVDLYAPNYIKQHPEKAAVSFDGKVSLNQICFMELVEGEYGRSVLEMVDYLAKKYPVDAIDLTELNYYTFCYCDRCLETYKAFSGQKDWPRNWITKKISRDHPSIGRWRSQLMAEFLKKSANIVHRYRKELYVDAPVSWSNFRNEAQEYGLKYPLVLSVVDKMVIWNYFYLKGKDPAVSQELAEYLSRRFNSRQIVISIGLWGKNKSLSPEDITLSAYRTLKGGINNLWFTPNHLISPAHWKELEVIFKYPNLSNTSR